MTTMQREVKVSGGPGRDAKVDSVKIQVSIDYANVDREELTKRAFAHDVVRVQNGILRDGTRAEWAEWEKSGFSIAGEEIGTGKKGAINPRRNLANFLMKNGFSEEDANNIVNDDEKYTKAVEMFKQLLG